MNLIETINQTVQTALASALAQQEKPSVDYNSTEFKQAVQAAVLDSLGSPEGVSFIQRVCLESLGVNPTEATPVTAKPSFRAPQAVRAPSTSDEERKRKLREYQRKRYEAAQAAKGKTVQHRSPEALAAKAAAAVQVEAQVEAQVQAVVSAETPFEVPEVPRRERPRIVDDPSEVTHVPAIDFGL